jgi:hypothetical protein
MLLSHFRTLSQLLAHFLGFFCTLYFSSTDNGFGYTLSVFVTLSSFAPISLLSHSLLHFLRNQPLANLSKTPRQTSVSWSARGGTLILALNVYLEHTVFW